MQENVWQIEVEIYQLGVERNFELKKFFKIKYLKDKIYKNKIYKK